MMASEFSDVRVRRVVSSRSCLLPIFEPNALDGLHPYKLLMTVLYHVSALYAVTGTHQGNAPLPVTALSFGANASRSTFNNQDVVGSNPT